MWLLIAIVSIVFFEHSKNHSTTATCPYCFKGWIYRMKLNYKYVSFADNSLYPKVNVPWIRNGLSMQLLIKVFPPSELSPLCWMFSLVEHSSPCMPSTVCCLNVTACARCLVQILAVEDKIWNVSVVDADVSPPSPQKRRLWPQCLTHVHELSAIPR